jgi:hypothetical protein
MIEKVIYFTLNVRIAKSYVRFRAMRSDALYSGMLFSNKI